VCGIDGCRAGWLVATVPAVGGVPGRGAFDVRVVPSLDDVVSALESARLAAAVIDIPIGLAAAGPRDCDRAARRLLGPRRSSVFPAPVRAVLDATSYADACAISRGRCGKGVSKQLYNILAKIREVDDVVSPRLQEQLFEACPELSFTVMSGGAPMLYNKRTAEGRAERVAALASSLGDVTALVDAPPKGATSDDVFDALALAWTGRRALTDSCLRLGGEVDETGLRMEITA
jgi:predicted RNase H-like nuclease